MTEEQFQAFIEVMRAIADVIKELKEVPSGHLYARLMGKLSLETYERIIGELVRIEWVERRASHLLVWTGKGK